MLHFWNLINRTTPCAFLQPLQVASLVTSVLQSRPRNGQLSFLTVHACSGGGPNVPVLLLDHLTYQKGKSSPQFIYTEAHLTLHNDLFPYNPFSWPPSPYILILPLKTLMYTLYEYGVIICMDIFGGGGQYASLSLPCGLYMYYTWDMHVFFFSYQPL